MNNYKYLLGTVIFVITVSITLLFKDDKIHNRILEANLTAAIELEDNIIASCGELTYDFEDADIKAPLFEGLGNHKFPISSASEESQLYFNQGLNLTYGFNHTEAHRSFKEASKLSDNSAMTYWGQAYALGPNINDPLISEQRKKSAHKSLINAMDRIEFVNELEKSLIKALNTRFAVRNDSIIVDNEAYMEAMRAVVARFDQNPDVLTLYAAAIMNTMPWNYWNPDLSARPNSVEALDALNNALAINPKHPGALHYRIHLTELPFPEMAAESGDVLATLMPGAGHMVHMPSHAYVRVGRYKDAVTSNIKAIKADESYISQCYAQGRYPLGYYPHNIHFLWSAASMLGDSETAIAAARKTAEKVSVGELEQFTFMQGFAAVPLQAYVRFGKWDELLTVPYPGANLMYYRIFWHYGRGMAFVRKGILNEAQEELDSLASCLNKDIYKSINVSRNSAKKIAELAYNIVAGELLAAHDNQEQADEHFKKALEIEDSLIYFEPPAWHLPTRHNYGDFLVKTGAYKKAEIIYKEDLKKWKDNGWSLIGLYNCYVGLGDRNMANKTMARFKNSWQYSDVEIKASVY